MALDCVPLWIQAVYFALQFRVPIFPKVIFGTKFKFSENQNTLRFHYTWPNAITSTNIKALCVQCRPSRLTLPFFNLDTFSDQVIQLSKHRNFVHLMANHRCWKYVVQMDLRMHGRALGSSMQYIVPGIKEKLSISRTLLSSVQSSLSISRTQWYFLRCLSYFSLHRSSWRETISEGAFLSPCSIVSKRYFFNFDCFPLGMYHQ